jgi:inorganic pyrophosphatase
MTDLSKFDQFRPHPWHGLSPEVNQADGDLLDICVLSERPINRSEVLVDAVVVGGLRAIYGVAHAQQVVRTAIDDYTARYSQSDRKDQ